MHALGLRQKVKPYRPSLALNEVERAARRMKVLDTICTKHGYTPVLIARMPVPRLCELIAAEGFPVFQPEALPDWVDEYLTAKNVHRN